MTAAVWLALCWPAAYAQQAADASASAESDTGQLEEVVITAQKRTERLQDVPVSASVLSSNMLTSSNVSDVSDLDKLVPTVNINGTANGRAPMGVRGISSVSNESAVGVPSGVAIMMDGVPIPSDSNDGNQIEDVQSVEVLEGPQTTLGGRTAAAGVINYRTYDPTDHFTGGASATGTTDSEYRGSLHVSGPLSDALEYSLSAYDAQRYLPITNTFYDTKTGQKDNGVRAKLLWKITDGIDAKLTYHHASNIVDGFNFVYVHTTPGADLLKTPDPLTQAKMLPGITPSWSNLDYDSPVNSAGHRNDDNDVQLDLNFDLAAGYTLTSTTSYQHETQRQIQDLFATAAYFFDTLVDGPPFTPVTRDPTHYDDTQYQAERISQKSEELKVTSPLDQPVSFVAGLFYSDISVNEAYERAFPAGLVSLNQVADTATYDVYGRATWKFAPSTSLIAGLRYNFDRISYADDQITLNSEGPFYSAGSSNSQAVVGDIGLQQQLAPDVMAYATYSRGYSPAAYNTAATLTSNAEVQPVGQEHIDSFEVGTKGTYFDRRLTLNLALFDTIYRNFQIQQTETFPGQVTSVLLLDPAGKAETRGAEFTMSWRATRLTTLDFSAAYIAAVFVEYQNAPCEPEQVVGVTPSNCQIVGGTAVQDMSGKPMPNAPKWKLFTDVQQRIPLPAHSFELLLDGNFAYRSAAQMLPDNNPNAIMGAYGILNLSVGLHDANGKWSVTAFCNNVANRTYYQDVEDFFSAPWSHASTVIAQPARDAQRYGGLRAAVNF